MLELRVTYSLCSCARVQIVACGVVGGGGEGGGRRSGKLLQQTQDELQRVRGDGGVGGGGQAKAQLVYAPRVCGAARRTL